MFISFLILLRYRIHLLLTLGLLHNISKQRIRLILNATENIMLKG